KAYWGYEDIGIFLVFATLLGSSIRLLVHLHLLPRSAIANPSAAVQFGVIALLSCALYTILKVRYRRPVLVALGWIVPGFNYGIVSVLMGIGFGCGIALYVRSFNHALSHFAFDELLLAAIFGPLLEESFFRGCLLPLLAQTSGRAAAIIVTALAFALFHSPVDVEHWAWFTLTGLVYGCLRLASGSTAAAAIMHACYNLTLFVVALSQ
ncbi:MAG TPA: CPBP family intramembrane glutamic endopeptidase, partial [Terriglobales bacterium]